MPASIIFNQVPLAAGVAGKARHDFAVGAVVTCSNSAVSTAYLWTLIDAPIRSALVRGTTGTNSTFLFTPDVKGTYLVTLRVDNSVAPADNTSNFCAILTFAAGTLAWRYKAAGERNEDNIDFVGLGFTGNDNVRGWATPDDLEREATEDAVYKVQNAVVTSPGLGIAALVKLDVATGKFNTSVVPTVTVAANSITNVELADVATQTFKGRTTAGTGDPQDLTVTQATALLNTFTSGANNPGIKGLVVPPVLGDIGKFLKGDGTWDTPAGSGGITALTSDVTATGPGSAVATIAADAVTNAKLANVATQTFKGRTTAGTGDPEDLTITQATALLNTFTSGANNPGIKGLVVAPLIGDIGKFLKGDGTWDTPAGSSGITDLTGDVTATGPGSTAATIAADAVTNAKLANVSTQTFKGRTTAGTGDPEDLTTTQATALLNTFTSGSNNPGLKGLVVAPVLGDIGKFLKGDGTWGTPTGSSGITDLTGDVTATGPGSVAATIAADAVTNAKLANVATQTFKGRTTAGSGDPEDLTVTQATALLNTFTSGSNNPGLKGLVVAPVLGDIGKFLKGDGTWGTPAGGGGGITDLTGDVTATGPGSVAATIAADAVTNAKLADVATQTFKGRTTAGTGDPEDLTVTQATALLNTFTSGSNNPGLKGLVVAPVLGDIGKFLKGDGTWGTPAGGGGGITDLTGDVTATGPGSVAATIAADAVTNAKLANVATQTFKGRTTAGTGDPEDLTATQATALLNTFTSGANNPGIKGLVVAPLIGDIAKFLKGDGTWDTPAGGGSSVSNLAMGLQETTSLKVTNVTIGGMFFDPVAVPGTTKLRMVGNYTSVDASSSARVYLYDMGPGTGIFTAVRRAVVQIPFASVGAQMKVDQTLTKVTTPGVDLNEIHDVARVYELRMYLNATDSTPAMTVAWGGFVVG